MTFGNATFKVAGTELEPIDWVTGEIIARVAIEALSLIMLVGLMKSRVPRLLKEIGRTKRDENANYLNLDEDSMDWNIDEFTTTVQLNHESESLQKLISMVSINFIYIN